jgi:uncharacterized protein (TIGR03437 family)
MPKCLVILSLILFDAAAAFPQISLNPSASREIGQPILSPVKTGNPNWIDGREFFNPEGIVLDISVSPPILYVADTVNNRVMAWKNATGFSNGQPADLIIGQPDQYTTSPAGPSVANTLYPTGLNSPIGLAVLNGDLFVADTGNNRILRFRKPFSQTNGNIFPDLWLGQPALTSATANYTGSLSATGLNLSGFQSYLAFDSSSNLWVSDAGNNRVVRFPAASFSCSNCGGGAADTVIGQPNLTSAYTSPLNTSLSSSGVIGNQFDVPAAVAFDAAGRLYVSDGGVSGYPGRILVFSPPFQPGGMNASGIMGVFAPTVSTQPTQVQIDSTVMSSPSGVFFFRDQSVGVIDSGFNRILIFPPYTQWPNQSTTFSPQATAVFGQINFNSFGRNGAQSTTSVTPAPANNVFSDPTAAFFSQATNQLFLTDTGNNRAIVLPVTGDTLGSATSVLGQDLFNQGSINLIEGREFQFIRYTNGSPILDAGIAIDNSGGTPHLYISDPNNHRILGFNDIRNLQSSAKANIVIGQPNLGSALCNYPSGDSALPTSSSLCFPKGIVVDSNGNLYVADSNNGRVLRFPAPFSQPAGQLITADLVLGQSSFTSSIKVPSSSTMSNPYGLAFTGTNGLLVSDLAYNRVLYIPFSANGTFAAGTDNGKVAAKVFGEPDFQTVTGGTGDASLSSPHHISCDTNGQLYVADSGNNRIVIFGDPNSSQTATGGQPSVLSINNLASPEGVYVNPSTGEIWVANTGNGTAIRYPKFETLLFNQTPIDANPIEAPSLTLAVAQDQFGDLVLADGASRVEFYYPGVYGLNAASFETDKNLAPGMLASIFPLPATGTTIGGTFGGATATNTASTWPTTLGGVQLLFNGAAVPLDYVSPTQINFQVPNGAPITGTATAQVVQAATGQIYGAGLLPMDSVSPGLFICGPSTGTLRQACVLNQDFSVNSGTNAAARGTVIQIFATGEGSVPNAPPDGTPASTATPSPASLRVFMGITYVDEIPLAPGESNGGNFIKYSGLAPGLVGVWQVNVQVPQNVAPSSQVAIALVLNGDVADPDIHSGYSATIAVK